MRRALSRKKYSLRLSIVVTAILVGIALTSIGALMASNSVKAVTAGHSTSSIKSNRPRQQRHNSASANGTKIVFGSSRLGGNHDIYVMDLDGSNQTRLTTNTAYDDQPKWSPDGTKIAFMSNRDGNFEIYSMNADGSNQTRLTNNPAADGFPAWSPDGTKIAFVNGDLRNPETFEIYVMNANGSNRIRLTNDSLVDGVPSWSPDGTKIVFMGGANSVFNPNSFEIFVMNADGNNRTQLTSNSVADGQPSYSPDGTRILFASGDALSPNGIEIFVMNANGSNRTQLTTNSVTDGFPVWSPDGSRIVFASGSVADETTVELFMMNADGSNRTQLTNNSDLDWFADWQPAPVVTTSVQFSSVAYSAGEGDASVVITVNRTLDTTGTSTVDFSSSNGSASQAKDYEVANGTLTFAPGQTSRTFRVLLVDDAYVEGNETLNLTLSNPTGAAVGSPAAATLTIVDNDTGITTSPASKQFVADLTGTHEVPPNNSPATGGGVVQVSASESTAKVSLVFSGLTFSELIARIHGPSGPEANAPPIFILPQGSPVVDFSISLAPETVADMRAGRLYMNVHSTGPNFANGEIRGQLLWNPVEEADFFVRQAYFDFLGRLPDPGGFAFWTNEITQCQSDVECLRRKRVDVSNAFFYEQEFQQTAAYVLRLYRGAYGNNQPFPNPIPNAGFPNEEKKLPSYAVFVADRARVIGGANLAQKQLELANLFVTRPEFVARYPTSLATADQFVDALLLTLLNDLGVNLSSQRANLISIYNTQGGRGAVMYRLADDNAANPIANQLFIDEEYNRSFVLGQYFGYLRRSPDIPGFIFWLGQVNGAPVRDVPKQHAMVCSFITAAEYQQRFGPVVTRNNSECQASPTPTPTPAPQNRKIAFLSSRGLGGFNYEIYTMNSDGSQPARLTFDIPDFEFPSEFVWSPDGSRIAYQLNSHGRYLIVVMNADGSAARSLTKGATNEYSPAWFPDGSKIAFEGDDGIYVVRLSDSVVTKLANGRSRFPAWSPDGSRIAFVVETDLNSQIFVMDADGSNQTNLSNTLTSDERPQWSPDGSKLLFTRRPEAGLSGDVFVMNSDGLNQRKLTISQSYGIDSGWSPNGNKIVFTSAPTQSAQIFTMNADGSGLIRLTNNSAQDVDPQWSPDSNKIVFVSDRDHSGSFDIYIMNSDGSNQTRLTSNSGDNELPQWQPYRQG